ncbi:MAG TPA: hypothetical protein VF656_04000 [Pyrinomonadaceae bacterium]|jgi:hypothetical protein
MTPETFALFLGTLSPDAEEAGVRYTRLHEKLTGFFSMKGIAEPTSAADETIDRAAIKICEGAPVPDAAKYCIGIARNIARERWRHEQRESNAFLNFVADLADQSDEEVERIQRLLKPCFESLAVEEQSLIQAYCQVLRGRSRAEHRRQLAQDMKTTVLALRMRVTRLRGILTKCVEKHAKDL